MKRVTKKDKRHSITQVEECYRNHFNKVLHFANSYLCDIVASYDITSEVFTVVLEKRSKIDFSRDLLPYLITLTRNACLNRLKRIKVEQKYIKSTQQQSMEILLNYRSLAELSSTDIFSKEVEEIFYKTLEELPPKTKTTFLLSRINGMKYREIAEELDVSIKTVEKRITQTLEILRINLKDYLPT